MKFYNKYHLGDSIYSLIYLNNIEIENIEYSFNSSYYNELNNHNYKNISLTNDMNGIDLWIQANNFWGKYITNNKNKYIYYDDFYLNFYNDLSDKYKIKSNFNDLYDILYYHPNIENNRFENYDYFIMNSVPLSGQYKYNKNDFIYFVNKLVYSGYKIITTEKIDNVECTRDFNMNLLDIANLSIGCKNIIGVHSSPYSTALNKKSIDSVENWYVLNDKNISYKIKDNFHYCENILDIKI